MSISVEHISKTFKNKRKSEEPAQVLKDVSFTAKQGEVTALAFRMWEDNNIDDHCRIPKTG